MAKIVCVLYPDPVSGYPPVYARDDIPVLDHYPDGQSRPTPEGLDFVPGQLLGCVSGELGLRPFLEREGHTLVVTSDKEGPDSVLDRELPNGRRQPPTTKAGPGMNGNCVSSSLTGAPERDG